MSVSMKSAAVESLLDRLSIVEKDIESVSRKKLITIVSPGSSDKVMYIQPFDLRGKDPEEMVEVVEKYVTETNMSQGFAQHKVAERKTGNFVMRGPVGPFGPTYKIDTSNQDGEREWAVVKRVLDGHVSRLSRIPEPIAYHQDITDQGMIDLRNISITKEDVPLAQLEQYPPLMELQDKKAKLLLELSRLEATTSESSGDIPAISKEDALVSKASEHIFNCPECSFVAKNMHGLNLHITKAHRR